MLVFSKASLVFLSVPKTGTTAYHETLSPMASMVISDPPELKHAPVFRYNRFFRPMLEKFVGEHMDVVAVMREPISWLGSWYRYRQRPSLEGHCNSTHAISFDDFALAYLRENRPAYADVGSQAKFLTPTGNGTKVTHLFRYEDQQGLKAFLQDRLGTKIATRALNVSGGIAPELSDEVEKLLRRGCATDFTLWDSIRGGGRYTAPARKS